MNHTPTPWMYEGFGHISNADGTVLVMSEKASRDDAEFIVRACNAHEELLAAAKMIVDAMGYALESDAPRIDWDKVRTAVPMMEKAIAKAKGGKP